MTATDDTLARAARTRLATLADPDGGGDIVSTGRVESVQARDGLVQVTLRAARAERAAAERVAREAERLLAATPGVLHATVVLTAHRAAAPSAGARPPSPEHRAGPPPGGGRPKLLGAVGRVVAVASGKGGVGKSTVAVNLAAALARRGGRIGLIDADIHGPSVPRMLGLDGKPAVKGDRLQPLSAWGVSVMSMGFLVPERQAMIWRGPMVMGALEQLMGQVDWPPLDVMVIDLPPGTGDAQLTLSQRVSLTGAVIVSTPQDIALVDARRGIDMFNRTGVPVLGLVENMSVFCCPACGHRAAIFGEGGARREAERLAVPFLGAVPLAPAIREAGDRGEPVVLADPHGEAAGVFDAIARAVEAAPVPSPDGARPA